jgi:glycerol-3-phosphate acyltransferase PlsY
VLLGRFFFDDAWATALGAAGAVVGHTWPVFAGFRGGRGVATSFGAFLAMAPLAALATLVFGLAVLVTTRYVSLMSVSGVLLGFIVFTALIAVGQLPMAYLAFGVLATLAVELNHLGNIRRLIAGTEPKLGQGGAPRSPRSV